MKDIRRKKISLGIIFNLNQLAKPHVWWIEHQEWSREGCGVVFIVQTTPTHI